MSEFPRTAGVGGPPASGPPRPRESADRCAFRADVRGDAMLGTAFPASRLMLVEQPGAWGHGGLLESEFDPAIARELLQHAGRLGMRVEAIRRPGRTPPGARRRWALVDARDGHETLRWGEFTDDAELLDLHLDADVGVLDDAPLYLVCTHGKHDVCCAVRGRPVTAALAQLRPGRVWECSHLGGDRFAANVLVLPSGLLYGRVQAADAGSFVADAEAGDVRTEQLRGQIGLTPPAQAALAFGHDHLAVRRRAALRVRAASPVVGGVAYVELDGPTGQLDVIVRVEQVPATGLTCGNPRPSRYLAYRADLA